MARAFVSGDLQPELLLFLAIIIAYTVLFFFVALVTMRRRLTV
jgi:hypothetical protein